MDDKEKEEVEQILSKSRRIQVAGIKTRDKQIQKDITIIKEDLLEINDESKKRKRRIHKK